MTSNHDGGPPARRRGKTIARRVVDAHRGRNLGDWGIVLGIYSTLILGSLGLIVNFRPAAAPEEAGGRVREDHRGTGQDGKVTAGLKLARVTASLRGGVPTTVREGDSPPVRTGALPGVHIDITLRNLSDAPARLSKAELVFRTSGYPEPCYALGGPRVYTAGHTLAIPDDQPFERNSSFHKVPFSLSRELAYAVPAHGSKKFAITVGPRTVVDQGNPWWGVFDVVLDHGGGRKLTFGPLAVVGSGTNSLFHVEGDTWRIGKEHIPGCTKRNAAVVAGMMRAPGLVPSSEFTALDKALERYR